MPSGQDESTIGRWAGVRAHRPALPALAVFYAAYVLTGGWSEGLALIPGIAIRFWPPAGLFVAALLLTRPPSWPWWVAAGCAAELTCNAVWFHNPPPAAVLYFAINAVEAVTAAALIRRAVPPPFRLDSPRQVLALVLLGAGVGAAGGATLFAAADHALGRYPFLTSWPLFWLGDATGLLVSTPLAVAAVRAWRERTRIAPPRLVEAGVLAALLVGAAVLGLRGYLPTVYVALPLVLWAAVRFHLPGAAVALALAVLTTAADTAAGRGEFTGPPAELHAKMVELQTFLGVTAVCALLAAVLAHLHWRANADLEARVAERTAALHAERERLTIALRTGRLGAYEWDLRTQAVWWSPELYPLFGVDPAAFTPTADRFLALVHPDDRAELWRKTEQSVAGGPEFAHEYRVVRPDGSTRWVYNRSRVRPAADGTPAVVVGVVADVTERKEAEERLRASEERLRVFIENAPATLAMFDRDMRYLAVSRRWLTDYRLTGDVTGRSHYEVFTVPERWKDGHRRALAGEVVRADEERYVHPDGSVRWQRWEVRPWHDAYGGIGGVILATEDITARKRAEEKLRAGEERLRQATQAAGMFAWEADLAAGTVAWSDNAAVLIGCRPDDLPTAAADAQFFVHPADSERVTREFGEQLAGSATDHGWEFRGRDGGRWWQASGRILRDAAGRPVRVFGVTQDVTARKRAEEGLRASEERFRVAITNSPIVVYTCDRDLRYQWFFNNPARFAHLDVVGKRDDEVLPAEVVAELVAFKSAVLASGVGDRREIRLDFGQGAEFYDVTAEPVRDEAGAVVGLTVAAMEITARKRAEEGLRANEELFRLVTDAAPALISYIDPDFRYRMVNRAYEQWFGRPREQVAGRTMAEVLGAAAWATIRPHLERAAAGEPVEYEAEVAYQTGGTRWIHAAYTPDRDTDGRVRGLVALVTDITARKRAEEAVRASEERLRQASRAGGVGLWEWDAATDRTVWSEVMWALYGRPADGAAEPERVFQASLHPADADRVRAAIAAHLGGPATEYRDEFRIVRPDGDVRWLQVVAEVRRDAAGRPVGMAGVNLDVTARRQAEEGLKASEAFARQVSDIAPSILYVYDLAERRNVWANRETFAGLGYTREQLDALSGDLLPALLHPDDLPRYAAHFARLTALTDGEAAEFEYRMRAADGGWRWLASRDMPFRRDAGGRVTQIIGAALDVTARKRSEEEADTGRRTLHAVIERCPFGIYIVDADFRIANMNAGSQTGAFANVRPVLGRPFDEAMRVLWPEPVAADVIRHFRHTLATGEPYLSADFVNPRADTGRTEGYEWELHRLTLPDGRHGVVCYYYDSTRLRQAEQALRDADRKKDEFLAVLAHELRNPLAPIRAAAAVLGRPHLGEPDLDRARGIIDRQVRAMTRLIDDLMDVSRIRSGKIQLKPQRVDLADVVRSAVETSRPLVDDMGHTLAVDLPPDPIPLDADPVRLAQVLLNLLNNAAKYTEPGGHIRLTAEAAGGEVAVRVTDTGIGIPADKLPTLFEMFTQVGGATDRAQGGLGIGLNLVKRLVEKHGGRIDARSDGPGRGSEFTVTLPVAQGTGAKEQRAGEERGSELAPCSRPPAAPRRVLVVDDNADAADSLAMLLELSGHAVHTAHDGEAAITAADQFRPDVVLCDLGLPKLSGYEVCRRIRCQPWGQTLTLVAVTGRGLEADKRAALDCGFDHHLIKPVDPTAVVALLAARP